MELRVDDRERYVIKNLEVFKDINIKVERITVGDYAVIYKGLLLAIIERKTLTDLAASIKDGRMDNNDKLLYARENTGCSVIYIIEGSPFSSLQKKYGRIPFKALLGKIDSLRFRHNVKIIWTKDCASTADRLRGLCFTLMRLFDQGVFTEITKKQTEVKDVNGGGVNEVIKARHETSIDQIHVTMLTCIKGVTRIKAVPLLKTYTIHQLLLGQTDEKVCYNMIYPGGKMKFGSRGTILHNKLKRIDYQEKCKILTAISGVTLISAEKILAHVSFENIISNSFINNSIAEIRKTEKRKIGSVVEDRIRMTFAREKVIENEKENEE